MPGRVSPVGLALPRAVRANRVMKASGAIGRGAAGIPDQRRGVRVTKSAGACLVRLAVFLEWLSVMRSFVVWACASGGKIDTDPKNAFSGCNPFGAAVDK